MQQFSRRPCGDSIEAVICQADRADGAGQDIMMFDVSVPVIDQEVAALIGQHFTIGHSATRI